MKIAKIIIRDLINPISHSVGNHCLLLVNRHSNKSTRASKREMSITNRKIYGKKYIHRNA